MKFRKDIQKVGESKDIHVAISQKSIEISRKGKPVSGLLPETVELDLRCGVNRKGFRIIIERQQTMGQCHYKITEILREENLSKGNTTSKQKAKNLDINVEEVQGISAIVCPHCGGAKPAVLQCGCGGLSCGGGTRSEGNKNYHVCPWCGSVGVIEGHIKTLSGERMPLGETRAVGDLSKQSLYTNNYSVKALPAASKQQIQKPGNKRITRR